SGKWSVQFTRRFLNSDGSFGGVVVASLDPEHLTKFYDRIDFGTSVSISLVGDDGFIRSSGGSAGGYRLCRSLTKTRLDRHLHGGSTATFEDRGVDGQAQMVTLRKVRGHPLWVSVSSNKVEIFNDSTSALKLNAIIAFMLTIVILAAVERILKSEDRARLK